MTNVAFLYIGNYKTEEEAALREYGINTVRLTQGVSPSLVAIKEIAGVPNVFLRSQRISEIEYESLFQEMLSVGVKLITSPESFSIVNDFAQHYPAIMQFSPKAMVADANSGAEKVLRMLRTEEFTFPVFVRSEIESAAKYVGVQGCTVHSLSLPEVEAVVHNLQAHVPNFRQLIIKEMVGLKQMNSKSLEYRAICAGGKLINFDYSDFTKLPDPALFGLDNFVEEVLASLYNYHATGAMFLDVAVTVAEVPTVVECKNFNNGSLMNLELLVRNLKIGDL